MAFSDDIPVLNGSYEYLTTLNSGDDFNFQGGSFNYLYIDIYTANAVSVTREKLEGLPNFVDNLAYDLSYANLSGVLFFVVPIMAISILFVLGLYLLKRLLNKIKRAKGGA